MALNGSYSGIEFEVAGDTFGYPIPGAPDSEGVVRIRVPVVFKSRAARNSMAGLTTRLTWTRTLGTTRALPNIEDGNGPATLVLPVHGGRQATYTNIAYLESMDESVGYGRGDDAVRFLARATLTFAIDGSGSV